jgi:hypothetical protein
VARSGCHGDAGRDAIEDEERRLQKAAAETEHSGQEADSRTQAEDDQPMA